MAGNHAAVLLAWKLISDFAGVAYEQGDFQAGRIELLSASYGPNSS